MFDMFKAMSFIDKHYKSPVKLAWYRITHICPLKRYENSVFSGLINIKKKEAKDTSLQEHMREGQRKMLERIFGKEEK